MTALDDYIDAWRSNDIERVAATVTHDVVVIESFGPVYLGRDRVREWVTKWVAEGNYVRDWVVTRELTTGDTIVAQWRFHYWQHGQDRSFDGATIATARDGKIVTLREYATTAELYDCEGEWR